MKRIIFSFSFVVLCSVGPASAQLAKPNDAGVAMGHLHLIVADVAATQKFFVTMGGTASKIRENVAVTFPGVIILLRQGTPAGPTAGSVVGHFAFTVPNSKERLAQYNAAGFKTMTNASDGKTLSDEFVKAQLTRVPPGNPGQFFVFSPDGLTRIEMLQEEKQQAPIVFHHVHYYVDGKVVPEIKAWYAKTFNAVPIMRGRNESADIPGANLSFTPSETPTVPTQGRMLDHVGFEVTNLEGFVKKLEAQGIKLEAGYKKGADGVGTAFLVDPWGTRIELTEGLRGGS